MEKIDFLAKDNMELTGFIYKTKEKSDSIILSVHGMASNCFKKREDEIIKKALDKNIDVFCFNNRGSELVKYIKIGEKKIIGGTAYEDVLDGYNDIVGAILKLKELGYKKIYLQGHSLGSTKVVYTYNRLIDEKNEILKYIKGIILLSLIDIPKAIKVYLKEKFTEYLEYATEKSDKGLIYEMMPQDAFIHPISVKTFLRYAKDNKEIDFAKYNENEKFEILNKIQIPIFMRWGNVNELIIQDAKELVKLVESKIKNNMKDISYIDGATHNYAGKEEILSNQIVDYIKK